MTDTATPSLSALLAEGRIAGEWLAGRLTAGRIARAHAGEGRGRSVLVIPGFLAADNLTVLLRRTLVLAGWDAQGWALGRNRGITPELLGRLEARLERLAADGPVALVGWSLGGLYARELAKRRPAQVTRVVTLASPFSGDLHANHARRAYEAVNGYSVDRPPVKVTLAEKPPVATIAIWSRGDGVVAPASTRGLAGERDRAVEVRASHMGMVCAPAALRAVLQALADDA